DRPRDQERAGSEPARPRASDPGPREEGAREEADARRRPGRDVHDHEPGQLRHVPRHAGDQPAAGRHPRHVRAREEAGRGHRRDGERRDRDQADDEPDADVRPPPGRRRVRGDVPARSARPPRGLGGVQLLAAGKRVAGARWRIWCGAAAVYALLHGASAASAGPAGDGSGRARPTSSAKLRARRFTPAARRYVPGVKLATREATMRRRMFASIAVVATTALAASAAPATVHPARTAATGTVKVSFAIDKFVKKG